VTIKHWKRRLEVDVGGTHMMLSDLQVEFQVRQADNPQPDWAYIRFTNLSPHTSNLIFQKNASVQINAGYYEGPFGIIYDGNATQMRRGKTNGTDTYHDILCATGNRAHSYAMIQQTLPSGSTWRDVVMAALKPMQMMGVQIGYLDPALGDKKLPRSMVLNGHSRDVLRHIAETNDMSWTIFNGQFQMVKNSGNLPGVVDINPDSGMIGLPEQQLTGIVVRVLMNPSYRVAQQVHIDKKFIQQFLDIGGFHEGMNLNQLPGNLPGIAADGVYKIIRIDHDGSVKGQEWYTTLTCVAQGQEGQAAKGIMIESGVTEVGDYGENTPTPAP
jgi:hypothetical protein